MCAVVNTTGSVLSVKIIFKFEFHMIKSVNIVFILLIVWSKSHQIEEPKLGGVFVRK